MHNSYFEKTSLDQFVHFAEVYAQNVELYTQHDKRSYAYQFLENSPKFVNEKVQLRDHQWFVLDQSFSKILKGEFEYWKSYTPGYHAYDDPLKLVFKIEKLARRSFKKISCKI